MTREEFEAKAASGPNCGLYRTALNSGYVDWRYPTTRTGMWTVALLREANRNEQLFAYLLESLATALEHDDRNVATRAAFQAQNYINRLGATGGNCGGPFVHDAARAAIERVVAWVVSGHDAEKALERAAQWALDRESL